MLKRLLTLPLLFILCGPAAAAARSADIVLVVHGSAITDAARQQTLEAVIKTTTEGLGGDSRFGVFEFDADTHQQSPLEPVSDGLRQKLLTSLLTASERKRGKLNPATALEKAIYQLRTDGRDDARRIVIMLSDGAMATGDKAQDGSLTKWLKDGLSEEARTAGIRIYWLTFSEAADYQMIQSVTQKTDGKYFRAFTAASARSGILSIFSDNDIPPAAAALPNVNAGLSDRSREATGRDGGSSASMAELQVAVITAGVGGLLVILLAIAIRRARRKRSKGKAPIMNRRAEDKRVVLRDMSEFTAMVEYDITERRTYIGRLPREVTEHSCVIVIRDTSVGRDHASIEYRDKAYWLSDNGTVNGTYVNGKRLQGTRKLMGDDRIRFARFEFKIHIPPALAEDDASRDVERGSRLDTITRQDDERTVFRSHQR